MAEEEELVVAGEVVAEVIEREAPAEGGAGANADASKPETAQVGSVEFLGRWKAKSWIKQRLGAYLGHYDRAMPVKFKAENEIRHQTVSRTGVRVGLGTFVDQLVQTNASSGILAISNLGLDPPDHAVGHEFAIERAVHPF